MTKPSGAVDNEDESVEITFLVKLIPRSACTHKGMATYSLGDHHGSLRFGDGRSLEDSMLVSVLIMQTIWSLGWLQTRLSRERESLGGVFRNFV